MVAKGGNQSLLRELEPLEREMCKKSRQKLFGSLSVTLVFICFFFSTPLQLPEIPTASLYSSPPPVLSISFPQNQKFEVFLSQRYFTAVIQTLMQLILFFFSPSPFLSLSRLLFPGVTSDIQRAGFRQNTNALCSNRPAKLFNARAFR